MLICMNYHIEYKGPCALGIFLIPGPVLYPALSTSLQALATCLASEPEWL